MLGLGLLTTLGTCSRLIRDIRRQTRVGPGRCRQLTRDTYKVVNRISKTRGKPRLKAPTSDQPHQSFTLHLHSGCTSREYLHFTQRMAANRHGMMPLSSAQESPLSDTAAVKAQVAMIQNTLNLLYVAICLLFAVSRVQCPNLDSPRLLIIWG